MRAIISTAGRFQPAFVWAAYLESIGSLERLVTPVNYGRVEPYGVSRARTTCLTPIGAWNWGIRRVAPLWAQEQSQFLAMAILDAFTRRLVARADVFNGWTGSSLRSIQRAHEVGLPSVLQTGSAHIRTQRDLIAAEIKEWGIDEALPHPRVMERAVREYEAADLIVAPSRFVERTFIAEGVPESKIRIVPWAAVPIHTPAVTDRARQPAAPMILFVGGCSLRKGIPSLIESARRLRGRARFRLVGQPNPDLFSRLGGLPDNMTAVGPKSGEDLASEYREADIFVLPSIEDGSALVTIEAMLAGLPVVVSDQAGAALLTEGKSGFVFPAGDSDALTERLLTLIADPGLRANMGSAAREAARPRTPQVYGRELIEQVYDPLLSLTPR